MASPSTKPPQLEESVSPAVPPARQPLSRWWLVGLLAVWPVFIAVGCLLLGVGLSEFDGTSAGMAYAGMITGGYACIGLGVAVKIAFWALVIRRHRQQRRFPAPPVERPVSKWWLVGLFIPAFALIVTGATVFGLGLASFDSFDTRVPNGPHLAEISGGLACLAIGLALMIAFGAVAVVRQRQRRRARLAVPQPGAYIHGGAPGPQMGPPAPAVYTPQQHFPPGAPELSGERKPSPATAELSGRQQPAPATAELSGLQQPAHSTAELPGRGQYPPGTAELSGQHLVELSPTPTSAAQPPHPAAAPLGQYIPQQYSATAQARASPPISTTAEPSALAPRAELPAHTSPNTAAVTPAAPHPSHQHPFSDEKEAAPYAEKEPVAKFCRYCGAALDPATRVCGQCGV